MSWFNENSRVKIPALLHLTRLGYRYLPLRDAQVDERCNLFPQLFREAIARINPGADAAAIQRAYDEIHQDLRNDDLGRKFHERLTATSGLRLFDFDNPDNNSWHVVTELTFKNGEDEFRPDITLLLNGMPLVFVEVKKPNNPGGVLQERERMDRRHANPKFRRFFNLVQLMLFSNNMAYDDSEPEPLQGAFYAASTYGKAHFNHFREEHAAQLHAALAPLDPACEDAVLQDNNLASIKNTPELQRNKATDSPTNALLTSLCSRQRLAFLLRYGFAYVQAETGPEKHVMRYPQLFATLAIARRLEEGGRKGIIWHTQGSGKTALTYFSIKFLTDWFHRRGQVPRFYFVVDRIDLLEQADGEFTKRGLHVHRIQSRDDFAKDIRLDGVIRNPRGLPEITLVNIQKFKDDADVVRTQDYNLNVQRVYFLDEVHRSYNPRGSFLANLEQSDRSAIHIGLTGTPLIGEQLKSKDLFGDYIHTYYYNASIADGYTLRLIREDIATRYQQQFKDALKAIEVKQGSLDKSALFAHPNFVAPMLDYIVSDFLHARTFFGDDSIGGMVICDSAEQARALHTLLQTRQTGIVPNPGDAANEDAIPLSAAADIRGARYAKPLSAALILHDEGDKPSRRADISAFKNGQIDLLFVYNMLLTGFDAPRLKKLYMARAVRQHNLLQALTRVNRRYKAFRYGYVVDFADIQDAFDQANRDYYAELNVELGDEAEHYNRLFKSADELRSEIEAVQQALFGFSLTDKELFSRQVSAIADIGQLRALVKALSTAGELYNLIRLGQHHELRDLLDFNTLRQLQGEAQNALARMHLKQRMEDAQDTSGLLNEALEDVLFQFEKVGQAELKLADELKDSLRRTRELLAATQDPQDPKWISLQEELKRLFKSGKLNEVTQADMQANLAALRKVETDARALDNANQRLTASYQGDAKLMRVHKRLLEKNVFAQRQPQLQAVLLGIKRRLDGSLLDSHDLLQSEAYFSRSILPIVIENFQTQGALAPDAQTQRMVQQLLAAEYLREAQGRLPFA